MFTLLAYSASCGVIIAQPDVPFVLTSSGVKIPVINVAVNLKAFLLVGPLGLIAITTYLHIFLGKLNQISGLEEYEKQPFLFNFQNMLPRFLSFLIFYVTPPIVMVAFSWKSAVMEWRVLLYFATMIVTFRMLLLYLKSRFKIRLGPRWLITAIFIPIGIGLLAGMAFFSSYLSLNLRRNLNLEREQLMKAKLIEVNLMRANLKFADLSGADLSGAILGRANLSRANLDKANLSGAHLVGAKLVGAKLDRAILRGAILHKAELRETLLSGVDLSGADLSETDLSGFDLSRVDLRRANLSKANLSKAKLYKANLSQANLNEAILHETNLYGANLSETSLHRTNLGEAVLYLTDLHGTIIDDTTRMTPKWRFVWELVNKGVVNKDLKKADLGGADLHGTDLHGTNLSEADLIRTNLRAADLSRANLINAIGLTTAQLCDAKILYGSKFDAELEKQLKEHCPDLLKEP